MDIYLSIYLSIPTFKHCVYFWNDSKVRLLHCCMQYDCRVCGRAATAALHSSAVLQWAALDPAKHLHSRSRFKMETFTEVHHIINALRFCYSGTSLQNLGPTVSWADENLDIWNVCHVNIHLPSTVPTSGLFTRYCTSHHTTTSRNITNFYNTGKLGFEAIVGRYLLNHEETRHLL